MSGRPPPTLVSVVMPTLNATATLEAQLEALEHQTYKGDWELVVADNGSTDGTRSLVKSWADRFPSCRVVDAAQRSGVAHARGVGTSAARGDFIVMCDGDDVATPGWLAAMVQAARRGDLVGGRLDEGRLNRQVPPGWRGARPTERLPSALGFLPYAVTANMGVWRDVVDAVGGWRQDYAGGGVDVDFSWRAQLAGYSIVFAPDAVMLYRHRSELRALTRQFYRYGLAGPVLYRDYRAYGAVRRSPLRAARTWGWLLAHLPDLVRSEDRRGNWLRSAAQAWGRLRGSIRYRVLYL